MTKPKYKTTIGVTPEGEKYYAELQRAGYTTLPFEQRKEFNILLDLMMRSGKPSLDRFFYAGDTVMGRIMDNHPNLKEAYVTALHSLIKRKYVKAEKQLEEPQE